MDKFFEFLKENYVIILVLFLALLILVLIIGIVASKKNKRKKEQALAELDKELKKTELQKQELEKETQKKASIIVKNEPPKQESVIVKNEPPKQESVLVVAEKKEEKLEPIVKPAKEAVKEEEPVSRSKATGKWQIKRKSETDYYLYLVASNGEIMLSSEAYTSEDGAKSGVETIKKNVLARNFQVYCDKNGKYYFKLKTSNNRLLCVGEVFSSKANCLNGIDSLVRFCETAVMSNEILEELTEIFYVPSGEIVPAKEGYSGKWIIKQIDDMFMAMLYASNGELLVAGESYTTQDAAKKSIDNIIKNALVYNFIIDRNKNDKYYFKLRNINRNVICVGEAYDNKAACVSAIESVIRFCNTAKREF